MAVLDFYGYEVNDILKQSVIDHDSIGIEQVNVLPIKTGKLASETWTDPDASCEITGNRRTGGVTAVLNGKCPTKIRGIEAYVKLTLLGREVDSDGTIQPGTYTISFEGEGTSHLIPSMEVEVVTNDDDPDDIESHSEIVYQHETKQITVDDDFRYVRVELYFMPYTGSITVTDETATIFPFIRRSNIGDVPFEPYKPDLQTQISAIEPRVSGLENQVSQLSTRMSTCESRAYNASDAAGIERVNLMPFVDGIEEEEYEGAFFTHAYILDMHETIAFQGQSYESYEREVYWYAAYFNDYIERMGQSMSALLLPGDYVFDYTSFQSDTGNPIDFRYDIYIRENEDDRYTKAASTKSEGSDVPVKAFFSISEGEQVMIVAVAHRAANTTWPNKFIVTEPYLRRVQNENAQRTLYVKSLQEQINDLRAEIVTGGGYSEVQVENYRDIVREV